MAAKVDFPLVSGNQEPFQDRTLRYPRAFTFADGASAPLFKKGVVPASELEEIARITAEQIAAGYAGQRLLVVQVLEGARVFARMLLPYLDQLCPGADIDYEMGAVQVRSYSQGSQATAHTILTPLQDSRGRELSDCRAYDGVVLVDDLIDAGLTMAWLITEYLPRFAAKGVGFCTMLDKERARTDAVAQVLARHLLSAGRQVANDWLVGYGLDLALSGGERIPPLHLFRQALPGGVYAFNSEIEARLAHEYQQQPDWVAGQLAAYRCLE